MTAGLNPAPARIKLRGAAEIAAAVPYLVGFTPTASLVVIALSGPRSRVELTMRFDLRPDALDRDFADEIAARVAHAGADSFVAVCYPSRGTLATMPRRPLALGIERAATATGLDLIDALCVVDGRYRSYLCDDERCCPTTGLPVPAVETTPVITDLAAARALAGRATLPDRAALVQSIRPIEGAEAEAVREDIAIRRVELAISDDAGEFLRSAPLLVCELVRRYVESVHVALEADEVADVVLALDDIATRDLVIGMLAGLDDELLDSAIRVFRELARRTPAPDDAPVCTVLGCLAYADGDGALANVALERALDTEPDYRLAALIAESIARQTPPSVMRAAWSSAMGATDDVAEA